MGRGVEGWRGGSALRLWRPLHRLPVAAAPPQQWRPTAPRPDNHARLLIDCREERHREGQAEDDICQERALQVGPVLCGPSSPWPCVPCRPPHSCAGVAGPKPQCLCSQRHHLCPGFCALDPCVPAWGSLTSSRNGIPVLNSAQSLLGVWVQGHGGGDHRLLLPVWHRGGPSAQDPRGDRQTQPLRPHPVRHRYVVRHRAGWWVGGA